MNHFLDALPVELVVSYHRVAKVVRARALEQLLVLLDPPKFYNCMDFAVWVLARILDPFEVRDGDVLGHELLVAVFQGLELLVSDQLMPSAFPLERVPPVVLVSLNSTAFDHVDSVLVSHAADFVD